MESKCTTEIIAKVRPLVESGVTWPTIAVAVGVGESTLRHWKQVGSKTYNAEFAEMVRLAIEQRDKSKTRADQVVQSQFHKLVKVTKELRITGPKRPPSDYTKELLIWYADEVLDMILDPAMDLKEMRYHIDRRIEELTVEEMVKTKTETAEVGPNQAAVKNVETNTGKKDERWSFKDEIEHEAGKELKTFMDWLAGRDGNADDRSDAP